jgi:hypothetical protein
MTPMTMALAWKVLEAENKNVNDQLLEHGPDIQTLATTAFIDLLASHEVVAAFALWIGECTGLLGVTLEDITFDLPGNTDPSAVCNKQGAAAVVAGEELLRGET